MLERKIPRTVAEGRQKPLQTRLERWKPRQNRLGRSKTLTIQLGSRQNLNDTARTRSRSVAKPERYSANTFPERCKT